MIDSKLTFRIQEIPEGWSSRVVELTPGDLDFEDIRLKSASVTVNFEKTLHFIKVDFHVDCVVYLTCDRSLDEFEQAVSGSYEVLFKSEVEEVSETETSKVKEFNVYELTLSVESEVQETIYLNQPIKKIHPRYLDDQGKPIEFETRRFGERGDEDEPGIDPRWEALKKLKN